MFYIIGHIPPCSVVWNDEEQWNAEYIKTYANLTKKYSSIIAGQLFGHTHRDDFKMFFSDNNPYGALLLSTSISPNSDSNPSYRVFTYDPYDYYKIKDYTHYYTDLFVAKEDTIDWYKEYTFTEAYKGKDVGTKSLRELLNRMYEDSEEFLNWESRFAVSYSTVRLKYYCSIRYPDREEYLKCIGN